MSDRVHEIAGAIFRLFLLWLLSLPNQAAMAEAPESQTNRLQELLYGEALFYFQQHDYLSAITRLQLADAQDMLQPSSAEIGILLARLKLAYGLDIDAAFNFHALLNEDVPDRVRNRAWYELAKAFFHKGYTQAAAEALDHIRGEVPQDIRGDQQLLQATVLLALNRNSEAADLLDQWTGPPELAGYARYNRGVALMRQGDYEGAIKSLEPVAAQRAEGEELLALRDKACLSLAYALTQTGNLEGAEAELKKVRLEGPFSNRALLALGWIAHKQGRTEAALVPWLELRGRSTSESAVLEALLIVPSVYRELDSLQVATADYQEAVDTLSDELSSLKDTRESVRNGSTLSLLLQKGAASSEAPGHGADTTAKPDARYLGRLLASRRYQETVQGHRELRSMLRDIDKGLHSIDELANAVEPGTALDSGRSFSPPGMPPAPFGSRRRPVPGVPAVPPSGMSRAARPPPSQVRLSTALPGPQSSPPCECGAAASGLAIGSSPRSGGVPLFPG